MNKVFEIRDAYTFEVLVDNLTLEEALDTLNVYEEFFGNDSVIVTCAKAPRRRPHISMAQEYKQEYIDYFAELQLMGNLL